MSVFVPKRASTSDVTHVDALIDEYVSALTRAGSVASFDPALSRALLHWPAYCRLLDAVSGNEALGVGDAREAILSALKEILRSGSARNAEHPTDWTLLLLTMTAAALPAGDPGSSVSEDHDLHRALYGLYAQSREDQAGRRPFVTENIGFYYRFAAAFQDWMVHHRSVAWYRCKQDKSPMPMVCRDCKAHLPPREPTRDALYLFYDNVLKTRTAFRAIFGICANDIKLEDIDGEDFVDLPNDFPITLLPDRRLWTETVWMMQEIEDLAYVHGHVHRYQRAIDKWLEREQSAQRDIETLFTRWIYKKLRIRQITLFVRSLKGTERAGHIAFNSGKFVEDKLGIMLPSPPAVQESDDRYERFVKVIAHLYKGVLPKKFFYDIEQVDVSATDRERTFPFILIPDGEINLYYALALQSKAGYQLNRNISEEDLDSLCGSRDGGSQANFWQADEWWNTRVGSGGVFPPNDDCHHRCAALVAVANMCTESAPRRLNGFAPEIDGIREAFCPVGPDGETKETASDPSTYIRRLLDKTPRNENSFERIINTTRVSFLPEILLRADDRECHTLFFLPVGQRRQEDNEDAYVPLAMIAGTLGGVEKRWLPFNSQRIVAHLYPLARILQPLIDKMSHDLFLQGEVEAKEKLDHEERRKQAEARRERIETQFKTMLNAIDTLSTAAAGIQKEIAPAPILFIETNSKELLKKLQQLFEPDREIHLD